MTEFNLPLNKDSVQAFIADRQSHKLYLGNDRTFPLNSLSFTKKSGSSVLMHKGSKGTLTIAALTCVARVDRGSCFISPTTVVTNSTFEPDSLKYALRLGKPHGLRPLADEFEAAFANLLSIQNINPAWKEADKRNMVLDDGNDGKYILVKAPVFEKRPHKNKSTGDLDLIRKWTGKSVPATEAVKKKVEEKMDAFIPHVLCVYEPDPLDINKFRRLSPNEIETKLPGAIIEATFIVKNNSFKDNGPYQSFSATLKQAVIWGAEADEPIPSVFDDHDPNTGPVILSPARPKRKAVDDEAPTRLPGSSGHATKNRKVAEDTVLTRYFKATRAPEVPKTPERKSSSKSARLAPKGKGKKVIIVPLNPYEDEDDELEFETMRIDED